MARQSRLPRPAALAALVVLALTAPTLSLASAPPAQAASDAGLTTPYGPTPPAATRPWVGVEPDWTTDTASSYVAAAHSALSLIGRTLTYPLTPAGIHDLRDLSEQSVGVGAVAVVTLAPEGLDGLNDSAAAVLSSTLATTSAQDGSRFLVRFAPDMNSGSVPWGQQPGAYVAAFRTVARAVHDSTHHAALVWSPAYGGSVSGAGADPYAPYYPGDSSVDWVGLDLPVGGSVDEPLRERAGYASAPGKSFYVRFAGGRTKPMLLTTGEGRGDWTDQVMAAPASRPLLRGVYLDPATDPADLGPAINARPATLAPVTSARPTRQRAARPSVRTAAAHASRGSYVAGVLTTLAFVVVAGLVLLQIRRRRAVPDWLR